MKDVVDENRVVEVGCVGFAQTRVEAGGDEDGRAQEGYD